MDPGEDIIDVLYNKSATTSEEVTNKKVASGNSILRRSTYSNGQYGFDYQHPPTRNYYEDLFQIQRRNFHGSDSVYETANVEKRSLCKSDSVMEVRHFILCFFFKKK